MSTTPRLRVLAGPSPAALTDISPSVNTNDACPLASAHFEGTVVVHIKGFPGAPESKYFESADRRGVTWSIQVQGRFLRPCSADDVLFGNTFDRPLKLPWWSDVALKFMHFIDPTLEHDLTGPKPWALSPLISTMPNFAYSRRPHVQPFPPPVTDPIGDDTAQLFRCLMVGDGAPSTNGRTASESEDHLSNGRQSNNTGVEGGHSGSESEGGDENGHKIPRIDTPSKRRKYFSNQSRRREIVFGPDDVLTMDFCYGFLSFPSFALKLPGGMSFDLKKYWDGQPVRFVCVQRTNDDDDDEDEVMFWCIVIEEVEN